ncbi:hypothetical protein ScPMuIL_018522 [Solemya velum]
MKNQPYALATDGSNDTGLETVNPLTVRKYNDESNKVQTEFLDMCLAKSVSSATAASVFEKIDNKLTDFNISWSNCQSSARIPVSLLFKHHRLLRKPIYMPEDLVNRASIGLPAPSLDTFFKEVADTPTLNKEEQMKYEWVRLATFCDFSTQDCARPIRLAEAGFYYSGENNIVVCFSCGVRYDVCSNRGNPYEVHKRLSSTCKIVMKKETRNVPIKPHSRIQSSDTHFLSNDQTAASGTPVGPISHIAYNSNLVSSELPGRTTQSGQRSTIGVVSEKPKHERYAVLAIRLSSFSGWPVYKSQTPQELAMAGLFYAGFGDAVRCFFCGGGLRNWEDSDDPWVEHARWFPKCSFVQQVKGLDFVQNVLEGVETQTLSSQASSEYAHSPSEAAIGISETRSESIWSSPAVLSILEMGYTRSSVENAVEKIIDEKHDITAEDVLSLILDGEDDYSNSENEKKVDQTEKKQSTPQPTLMTNMAEEKSDPETEAKKEVLLAEIREMKEQSLCKICMDEQSCIVFLPCGHLVACAMCAPAFRTCPICRAKIKGTVRASKNAKEVDRTEVHQSTPEPTRRDMAEGKSDPETEAKKGVLPTEIREMKEQSLCKICMDEQSCIAFLPCGHLVACAMCAPAFPFCPICRAKIKGTIRAYIS